MSEVGSQVYLLNFQFNQDQSCFSLATSQGFRTFTLQPLAEFSRRQVNEPEGQAAPVQLAAMLFQTNYVALVLKSSPYKVLLWDDSLRQKPLELWSRFEVLNVLLRRDVLCIVSEYKIYIYEFGSFQVLMHLETAGNPRGVCALAPGSRPWLLAAPAQTKGVIRLQNGSDDAASQDIIAHNNPIACIALSLDGGMVATASEQGTVVKVFSVADGKQLFAFRRGTTSTTISSLCFRPDAKFLAVGSISATVHIFRLEADLSSSGNQGRVPQYFQATRSFAQFRLPDVDANGKPSVDLRFGAGNFLSGPVVAFSKGDAEKIVVLHYNGILYQGNFNEKIQATADNFFTEATVVFAARPDFQVGASSKPPREDDEGNWQVI